MIGTNRKVIALIAGMTAGAGIGLLLSSFGKQTWIKNFERIILSGDNMKRSLTYRMNSILEKKEAEARLRHNEYEDFLA